ncbi:hypothetical protein chiPu_0023028 [Chiloscyllium punctatum]|uniref:Uncharacterized protein n=1 Tax=Chiloscyllium punctatum TaxID=137246 RepID=A0A401T984_CHIPU|nr:hypothetical protein [Chiloscyllium punctatum]
MRDAASQRHEPAATVTARGPNAGCAHACCRHTAGAGSHAGAVMAKEANSRVRTCVLPPHVRRRQPRRRSDGKGTKCRVCTCVLPPRRQGNLHLHMRSGGEQGRAVSTHARRGHHPQKSATPVSRVSVKEGRGGAGRAHARQQSRRSRRRS